MKDTRSLIKGTRAIGNLESALKSLLRLTALEIEGHWEEVVNVARNEVLAQCEHNVHELIGEWIEANWELGTHG